MEDDFIQRLKQELQNPLPGSYAHELMAPKSRNEEIHIEHEEPVRIGAVLALIYAVDNVLKIVYIKRPEYEGYHSGQVAFPGGKQEDCDQNPRQTALRETYEEIGVSSDQIQVVGDLSPIQIFVSNYLVYPFVGYCGIVPKFSPNRDEVSYIIEVPVMELIRPNNKIICQKFRNNRNYNIPAYSFDGEQIWGATAMITSELETLIKRTGIQF